jgi:hypothetical protein
MCFILLFWTPPTWGRPAVLLGEDGEVAGPEEAMNAFN